MLAITPANIVTLHVPFGANGRPLSPISWQPLLCHFSPGASFEYIERAVELADRVSLNLEAPNQARLTELAPDKEFAGSMWGRLAWAAELMRRARAEGRRAAKSITTQ